MARLLFFVCVMRTKCLDGSVRNFRARHLVSFGIIVNNLSNE